MAGYFERLQGLIRKAIAEYDMLQDGDSLRVGVSGGKDSVALVVALSRLREYMGIDFKLQAVTIDRCFGGIPGDFSPVEEFFREKGIPYTIKRTDIGPVIFEKRRESNPCSLCARMRRGALHNLCKELGCNKLALGHHLDDAIETFYMNLWYEGRIGTFSPVTYLSRKDITVIRPMILATEREVISASRRENFPVVKSACPVDGRTNRQRIKEFVAERCIADPSFRQKSLTAFQKKDLDGWGPKGRKQ